MSFRTCVFHIRIVLPFLLALTVHAQDPTNYCPITPKDDEYFVANQTCYFLSDKRVKSPSWTFAHNDCKRTKGSLLIFKDKSNEDAVITQITITSGFDRHLYWLDINRVGDSWEWTTGEVVSYTPNWETGNGNCAVINVTAKHWSSRDCLSEDLSIGYICQYDPKNFCPITPMDGEYFVANHACYILSGTTGKHPSWSFAHNDCKRKKGSLLIFKDKNNEDAVITQITITTGFDSQLYWLDINKVGDSWKWTTGATVTYTPNWETGDGSCAVINVATKSWSPRDCNTEDWTIGYICQYDSTSSSSRVTEDSTGCSSRVTLDAAILLTLVLTLYRIFVSGR